MTLDRVVAVLHERKDPDGSVTVPLFVMESGKCWWRVVTRTEGDRPSTQVEWIPAGPPVPETVAAGVEMFRRPRT